MGGKLDFSSLTDARHILADIAQNPTDEDIGHLEEQAKKTFSTEDLIRLQTARVRRIFPDGARDAKSGQDRFLISTYDWYLHHPEELAAIVTSARGGDYAANLAEVQAEWQSISESAQNKSIMGEQRQLFDDDNPFYLIALRDGEDSAYRYARRVTDLRYAQLENFFVAEHETGHLLDRLAGVGAPGAESYLEYQGEHAGDTYAGVRMVQAFGAEGVDFLLEKVKRGASFPADPAHYTAASLLSAWENLRDDSAALKELSGDEVIALSNQLMRFMSEEQYEGLKEMMGHVPTLSALAKGGTHDDLAPQYERLVAQGASGKAFEASVIFNGMVEQAHTLPKPEDPSISLPSVLCGAAAFDLSDPAQRDCLAAQFPEAVLERVTRNEQIAAFSGVFLDETRRAKKMIAEDPVLEDVLAAAMTEPEGSLAQSYAVHQLATLAWGYAALRTVQEGAADDPLAFLRKGAPDFHQVFALAEVERMAKYGVENRSALEGKTPEELYDLAKKQWNPLSIEDFSRLREIDKSPFFTKGGVVDILRQGVFDDQPVSLVVQDYLQVAGDHLALPDAPSSIVHKPVVAPPSPHG